jgi:D-alanine transfer protein
LRQNSPEFNDLKLLVDTLREGGADVEYVILPSNGKWYDLHVTYLQVILNH